jgi:hypothetical protein
MPIPLARGGHFDCALCIPNQINPQSRRGDRK